MCRPGVPGFQAVDQSWSGPVRSQPYAAGGELECNVLEPSQNHPSPSVHGKIVFHETGAWCQKGWGPLVKTTSLVRIGTLCRVTSPPFKGRDHEGRAYNFHVNSLSEKAEKYSHQRETWEGWFIPVLLRLPDNHTHVTPVRLEALDSST